MDALLKIVQTVNAYLSDYILIVLLICFIRKKRRRR